jgi:hypothetical protein
VRILFRNPKPYPLYILFDKKLSLLYLGNYSTKPNKSLGFKSSPLKGWNGGRTISRYCPSMGRSHEMTLKDLRSFDCPNIMPHKNKLFETFLLTFFICIFAVCHWSVASLSSGPPIIVCFSSAGRNLPNRTIHGRLTIWFTGQGLRAFSANIYRLKIVAQGPLKMISIDFCRYFKMLALLKK